MLLAKDLLLASGGGDFPTDPVRFDYTGAVQTYTVPNGCKKIHVDAVGAGNPYAKGGRVECDFNVVEGQTYYIYVGQTTGYGSGYSFNGGGRFVGTAQIYSGGGATDLRTVQATARSWYITNHSNWASDSSLLSRIIVAGGAGGYSKLQGNITTGGRGGGLIGGTNSLGSSTGGTQTAGGALMYEGTSKGKDTEGNFGAGAAYNGKDVSYTGGGSGWYGGGGYTTGAGGGGSSYTHPTLCSNVVHTQGYSRATGNGWLIITPLK